jgi:ribonuclease HI
VECFCDGGFLLSQKRGSTGYLIQNPLDEMIRQGNRTYWPVFSSFHNEKLALRDLLVSLIEDSSFFGRNCDFVIYTDSASLILSFHSWTMPSSHKKSPLTHEILRLINQLNCRAITLQWIPGQAGIPGNEYVDGLARKSLYQNPPKQLDLALEYVSNKAQSIITGSWNTVPKPYDPSFPDDTAPGDAFRLNRSCYNELIASPPAIHTPIIRLITNHYRLQGCHFRHILQKPNHLFDADSYMCRFCNQGAETTNKQTT